MILVLSSLHHDIDTNCRIASSRTKHNARLLSSLIRFLLLQPIKTQNGLTNIFLSLCNMTTIMSHCKKDVFPFNSYLLEILLYSIFMPISFDQCLRRALLLVQLREATSLSILKMTSVSLKPWFVKREISGEDDFWR